MENLIKKIDTRQFRNKTHFEFMSEMNGLFAATPVGVEKISVKTGSFAALLAEEDEAVVTVRKYEHTDAIAQMDADRDNVFRGIRSVLKAALRDFDPQVKEAAERLKNIFDTGGKLTRLNYDEETAAIDNLMQKLDARSLDVEATAIGRWTEELRRLNGELHTLMTARYSEDAMRSQRKMRKVREDIDAAYAEIVYLLEAAAAIDDNNACKVLFNEMNARITRYANILAQEKGRRKEKTDERINGQTNERTNESQ